MAKQTIGIGSTVNDGTGDSLRTAFTKANANFTELYDGAATDAGALASHTANTANPHSVTKAQVGLGNVTNDAQLKVSERGAADGVAPLDSNSKVPAANLPSYVDDVSEAANFGALPGTGETGKIYVTTDDGKTWRWSGSAYVEISSTPAFASEAEAGAGSDNTKLMTPLRTAQAIAALGGSAGSFADLTGSPDDNTALAAALAAKLDAAGGTLTGALSISANGASGSPALSLTGSLFTGGTGTTTKPLALLEPAGTTSNNWSTSGTMLGINAPSAFAGTLLDLQVNADAKFRVSAAGDMVISNSSSFWPSLKASSGQNLALGAGGFTGISVRGDDGRVCVGHLISFLEDPGNVASANSSLLLDSANALGLRNGTNAQRLRVYGTYSDSGANYERLVLQAGSGHIELAAESAGSGAGSMDVRLTPKGFGLVQIGTAFQEEPGISPQGFITIKDATGTQYDVLCRPTP